MHSRVEPKVGLTAQQEAVVGHQEGVARVVGAAGTGKTTALVARYLRLLDDGNPASQVVVVARDEPGAERFRAMVLPALAGGFDWLPVTTVFGLAFDLVVRRHGPVQLLSRVEQWNAVRRLLADEDEARWPTMAAFLGRRAFVDAVTAGLIELRSRPPGPEPTALGAGWPELAAFAARYQAFIEARGQIDSAGLVARAYALLDDPALLVEEQSRHRHFLVDDHETANRAGAALVARLRGGAVSVLVAGNPDAAIASGPGAGDARALTEMQVVADLILSQRFRHPGPPALVCGRHPSMEPEAIAGELLAARRRGVAWTDMAVLVRSPRQRGRGLARALARNHIPVAPVAAGMMEEPAVRAVVDMLRWVAIDDADADADAGHEILARLLASPLCGSSAMSLKGMRDGLRGRIGHMTPSELAFEVWATGFAGGEGGDEEAGPPLPDGSLDALVAFFDALDDRTESDPSERLADMLAAIDAPEFEPDPWRGTRAAASGEIVTVTSVAAAAGRQWHTVVLAGCVEGELPRVHGRAPLFDPAVLDGGAPPSPADRRQQSLERERRLFGVARNCAVASLIGTAAPPPGVLLSRFVEGWVPREPELPLARGQEPDAPEFTVGLAPVNSSGRLRLSASQLDTYDDCPLRYAYQYALGARGESGVYAELGTLVHEVMAKFLDPRSPLSPASHTYEALLALAESEWRDDIAMYRPQVEEARRDYFAMIEAWWQGEGRLLADAPGACPPGRSALEVLDVERRFDVEVGPHRLTGAIDRVDRADDGEGIRIVDYKTGRRPPSDAEMPDNLQLAVYYLAAGRDPELTAMGEPTQLRLLFLRTMQTCEQPVLPGHAAAIEARIMAAADDILSEAFDPSVTANCRNCDFHRLCPLQPEGREVVDA